MAARRPPPRRRTRSRRPPPRPGGRPPARRRRRSGGSDLGRRILWAIPLIAFAVFIVVEGGLIFAIGLAILGIACMAELFDMLEAVRPVRLAGFLAVIALALAALYGSTYNVLLMMVALLPVLFFLTVARPQRQDRTLAMAVTVLAVWWIALAIAHAVLLRRLPHGDAIIVDILVGTFLGDTAAYVGGRAFGRRPLAPEISPNKTLEGLLIGIVFAIGGVWFAGLYQDWLSGVDALLLGVAVALAAPLGDLFESLIKRDVGAKDTGALLGPHGGVLDRIDAVLFTVPVGFYVWHALM
ncbi:MAG TPA: phosphatidate cytidylyltransferase [Solirubrobacteraceae bacterium]|jgi:phosphatidate cytidylyltransferase|nr:phosphatidate cytidylyltransferase [Solirubrobacteraceae bacterium]